MRLEEDYSIYTRTVRGIVHSPLRLTTNNETFSTKLVHRMLSYYLSVFYLTIN